MAEPSWLRATRESYDAVAADYAELLADALSGSPMDRVVLAAFAELVGADGGALAGLVAWYSVIHTPTDELPEVFAEFSRVLRPGGRLVLASQVGEAPIRLDHVYGHDVSPVVHRRPVESVADLLADAGLPLHPRFLREPEGRENSPQAYLFAGRTAVGP